MKLAVKSAVCPSKQSHKIIHAEIRLPQYRPQSAAVEFAMRWNHSLSEGGVAPHDNVTAMLAADSKADPLESRYDLLPGNRRQLAHTASNNASSRSSGTGSPSS